MALLCNSPMTTEVAPWFQTCEAMGVTSGLTYSGRVDIAIAPDGLPAMHTVVYDTDPLTGTGQRAELRGPAEDNAERWYKFSIMCATNWPATGEYLVMQIHDTPDGGESPVKPPNFTIHNRAGLGIAYVPTNCPTELGTQRILAVFDFPLGQFVDFVLHTNFGTDATGWLELIVDGKSIAKEWLRPCGYSDAVGPYFKIGVYDFLHSGGFGRLNAWYRDVSVWSTGESYASVIAGVPAPRFPALRFL